MQAETSDDRYESSGAGWKAFAGIMILLVGVFNVVDGLRAVTSSNQVEDNLGGVELPLTNDVKIWGWVVLITGVVMILAGFLIFSGNMFGRIVGVLVAGANAIVQLSYLDHNPFWSFTIILVDVLVIYGLVADGGRLADGRPVNDFSTEVTNMPSDTAHPPATTVTDRPTVGRRFAAILSILLVAAVAIASVVLVLDWVGPLIVVLALFAVIALAVWYALTRAGGTRTVAVAFAIAAVVGVVALVISESAVWSLVVRIALLVLAAALARYALARDVAHAQDAARRPARPSPPPRTAC